MSYGYGADRFEVFTLTDESSLAKLHLKRESVTK
jgi:hypothetical protein